MLDNINHRGMLFHRDEEAYPTKERAREVRDYYHSQKISAIVRVDKKTGLYYVYSRAIYATPHRPHFAGRGSARFREMDANIVV